MKNKIFNIFIFSFLIIIVIFFLILILGLFQQLGNTSFQKKIYLNEIYFALKLTLLTATISSIIAIIFAIPVGYILARYNFFLKNFIDSLLYLPFVISPVALGAMLLIFFGTPIGNFIEKNLFKVVFEIPGIIIAQFVVIIGLAINLVKSIFEYIDPSYEEIAQTLGASKFYTFRKIVLPIASRGIISSFLLVWARAIGEFGATVTLAGASPMKTETLPVAVFLSLSSADIYNAIILILISISISITILFSVKILYAKSKKFII